jgi:hypothetical protein
VIRRPVKLTHIAHEFTIKQQQQFIIRSHYRHGEHSDRRGDATAGNIDAAGRTGIFPQ